MSNKKTSGSVFDSALITRRALFLICLLGLATIALFFTFQGLTSPRAMEQAQLGREIARGNSYSTKVIRPVAVWQMQEAAEGTTPTLKNLPDTYHAPLNPCVYAAVIKAVGADKGSSWQMNPQSNIYQLDRVIAATCLVFFFLSIGINYLLISRIFDTAIAATVAILMMFCELMWSLSQSGLPQMLMLMLFSCAMYFSWRAIEQQEEKRSPLTTLITAGVFLCLLVLTHWITIWIYFGYVTFAAIYFKPKGVIAAVLLGLLATFVIPVIYLIYVSPTGSAFGTAYYAIHDGLGLSQDNIMRSLSPANEELGLQGLILNIFATTLGQISQLYQNLGAILVAPLFFLALLHPFKRITSASFRWLILLMWVFASLGMSIYGLKEGAMDSNQIHILFAPLMAAYGLAIVSILWSRLKTPSTVNSLKHAHLVLIVAISAGPMLLSIPKDIKMGLRAEGFGGFPNWPPYWPAIYNRTVAENTTPDEIIICDAPWAVAWYADRMSVWLPRNLNQIEQIEQIAKNQQTPVSAILITPYSYNSNNLISTVGGNSSPYSKLFPLVMGGWGYVGNQGLPSTRQNFIDNHPDFLQLARRFPHKRPLFAQGQIMWYSARPFVQPITQ